MGPRKELQCVCLSVVTLVAAACLGYDVCTVKHGSGYQVTAGCATLLLLVVCGVLLDILRQRPADSHTWPTLLLQYVLMTLLAAVGSRVYNKFITSSKRVHSVQGALLLRILQHNKDTVYGTEHDFSSVKTRRDFTETQPLVTYADLKPYFDRIQDGEHNVLTKDPVIFLALSSGTTGKNKVIPITSFMRGPAAYDMAPLMYYISKKKAQFHMQRVLILSYKTRVQYSKCGLPMAPVSTHMSRYFPFVVSPRGSYEITNEQVALHVHAVFALGDREVGHIESLMSTLVYSFWIYIEHNWQQLCSDIELGRLSLTTDQAGQEIITQLNEHLRPNPARATELRAQFRSSSFHGIAKRIWPNLRFVRMLSTGGCAHHAKALRDCHMSGVIQVSLLHAASEGFLGVNVFFDPDNFNYAAMISYGFMEFIPEDLTHEQQPAALFAEQKDNLYEIVLTTPIGIYRYRTGDVVKVVDHLHQCPIYEFQYRLGQLNLYWEKTPECVFYSAVERSVGQLGGVTLVDYSATEDLFVQDIEVNTSLVKHYVLMIELRGQDGIDVELLDSEKAMFDVTLCAIFDMYATFRRNGSIGPMRVVQLKPRSFEQLKEKMTEHLQNQQYEVPRVLRKVEYLGFLLAQRL